MNDLHRKTYWILALLLVATAALAQKITLELPKDNVVSQLKKGPGEETTSRNCSICHSTDYIVTQPRLDPQRWDAEIKKMIKVYGAHVSDSDARIIADYLGKNYAGPSNPH